MMSSGQALIQYDWCPYEKRKSLSEDRGERHVTAGVEIIIASSGPGACRMEARYQKCGRHLLRISKGARFR